MKQGFLLLSFLAFVSSAFAAAPEFDVYVYGNHVFDEAAIIQMSGINQNPKLSAEQVRKHLQTTSLFEDIEVEKDEAAMIIIVHEKTTWFVLPYFSSDQQTTIYGAAAGKAGILGQDVSLLARYQMGNDDQEGSALLRDEFFMNSRWILGGSFDYEDSKHKLFVGRDVVNRLANRYYGGSFQTGYHFRPDLILGFNTYIEQHSFQELDGHATTGLQVTHRIKFDLGTLFNNEGLIKGARFTPYFETGNPVSDFQFRKYGLAAEMGLFLHGDFNWIMSPRFEASAATPRYQLFELGGGMSLRGFETQEFRDSRYFMVSNDFLLTAFDVWKLKVRPLVFTDWAYIQNSGRTDVGVGLQVFFRTVAVPAVQVFGGWGFNPDGFSFSAAIGPQF